LDNLGGGRRAGVIGRLRKALTAALGRADADTTPEHDPSEADRRLEAARRRLKKTIPPRED
jgi:hypothetical protein